MWSLRYGTTPEFRIQPWQDEMGKQFLIEEVWPKPGSDEVRRIALSRGAAMTFFGEEAVLNLEERMSNAVKQHQEEKR